MNERYIYIIYIHIKENCIYVISKIIKIELKQGNKVKKNYINWNRYNV